MNARQKAKKLKKENKQWKAALDRRINPASVISTSFHPEILRYKRFVESYISDDMIRDEISKYCGEYLMNNGFIEVFMRDERNDIESDAESNFILDGKFVEACMIAVHPHEYYMRNIPTGNHYSKYI